MLYSEKMPILTAKYPAQTVTVDGAAYARDMFETIFKDFQQAKDAPFFHLELHYEGDTLAKAVLDGEKLALL